MPDIPSSPSTPDTGASDARAVNVPISADPDRRENNGTPSPPLTTQAGAGNPAFSTAPRIDLGVPSAPMPSPPPPPNRHEPAPPLVSPEAVTSPEQRSDILLQAVELARDSFRIDVEQRYRGPGPASPEAKPLVKFLTNASRLVHGEYFGEKVAQKIAQTKAYFAGEYADIKTAENLFEQGKNTQGEFANVRQQMGWLLKDAALRAEKILGKTALTGGIGAVITVCLAGSTAVASPIFFGALGGAVLARGAFELFRMVDPKERDARVSISEARAHGLCFAQQLQNRAAELKVERNNSATTDARRQEIDHEMKRMHRELFAIAHESSFRMFYDVNDNRYSLPLQPQEGTNPNPNVNNREISYQGMQEKMTLQNKREGAADFAAAIGAMGGGAIARKLTADHLLNQLQTGQEGIVRDFDGDKISHFVRHVDASQLQQVQPGFQKSLEASGGWVYAYNPGEHGQKVLEALAHSNNITTAILPDGTFVHALGGAISPDYLNSLVATQSGNLLKSALPLALANLLPMMNNLVPRKVETLSAPERSTNTIKPELGKVFVGRDGRNYRWVMKKVSDSSGKSIDTPWPELVEEKSDTAKQTEKDTAAKEIAKQQTPEADPSKTPAGGLIKEQPIAAAAPREAIDRTQELNKAIDPQKKETETEKEIDHVVLLRDMIAKRGEIDDKWFDPEEPIARLNDKYYDAISQILEEYHRRYDNLSPDQKEKLGFTITAENGELRVKRTENRNSLTLRVANESQGYLLFTQSLEPITTVGIAVNHLRLVNDHLQKQESGK